MLYFSAFTEILGATGELFRRLADSLMMQFYTPWDFT